MAMMICPECGHSISDQARACPYCGYPVNKMTHSQKEDEDKDNIETQNSIPPFEQPRVQTQKEKRTPGWQKVILVILAVIGILFILLIILAMVSVHNNRTASSNADSNVQTSTGNTEVKNDSAMAENTSPTTPESTVKSTENINPIELQVGNFTLGIPGYYELMFENGKDGQLYNGYGYEETDSGAAIIVITEAAGGISETEFTEAIRKAGNELGKTVLELMDPDHKMQLSGTKEIEYKGMPGRHYDYTGTMSGHNATLDMECFLDQNSDQFDVVMLVIMENPARDVSGDYKKMLEDAAQKDNDKDNALTSSKSASVKESGSSSDNSSSDSKSKNSESKKDSSSSSTGVTPAVKETLDSYEKLMNEYCDFMEKYENADSSDALTMLSDYYDILEEYTEAMEKLSELDTSNMSTADYQYYLEVTARVTQRLAKVGQ